MADGHDYGIKLTTSQPAPPHAPLPLNIKVVAANGPIPQTVAGLAARVEQTINASLAVAWPGALVRCSAVAAGGGNQAIRVVGYLPGVASVGGVGFNDAVLAIGAPDAPLSDAAGPLGLSAATDHVAHYTLGTGQSLGNDDAGNRQRWSAGRHAADRR